MRIDKKEELNCKIEENIQKIQYYSLTERSNKNIVVNNLKIENNKLAIEMKKLRR